MKLTIQTYGTKGALPYNAPEWLNNYDNNMNDTERRIRFLQWLKNNKTDVNAISQIAVELQKELKEFKKTGKKDFHIYHCKGIYGFLHIINGFAAYSIKPAYYHEKEISTANPWYILNEIKDGNYTETCVNITVDKDNRIINI